MSTRPLPRSTSTEVTPGISETSSFTERTQCSQVMPVTVMVVAATGGLPFRCRLPGIPALRSGAHQARDRLGGLAPLLVGLLAAVGDGVPDAVLEVLVEHGEGEGAQRLVDRGGLGEDVDAVLVLLDHPLQPPDLA